MDTPRRSRIDRATLSGSPIRTVGEYLWRWGYSPQKPLKRAYEQAPDAVEQWLEQTYPLLEQRAQIEGAEIAWGDESGWRWDTQVGRGYAPIGETPEHSSEPEETSASQLHRQPQQSRKRPLYALQQQTDRKVRHSAQHCECQ